MKCPHCAVAIPWHPSLINPAGAAPDGHWSVQSQRCAGCDQLIIELYFTPFTSTAPDVPAPASQPMRLLAWPRGSGRSPCPPEVPPAIRGDYIEACIVVADSLKASAALSRRCLQHILREAAGVTPSNLAQEIDQVLASGKLHSTVADSLDAVREIGNFAAHPTKSTNTGEVIEVEPGEADWNLVRH